MGRRVCVIGAGNTAIDAAIAAHKLGAEQVHLIYRRGEADMSAFASEYEHARLEGIQFHWQTQITRVVGKSIVEAIDCGQLRIPCDMVIPAIGQSPLAQLLAVCGEVNRETGQTKHPKYFAGGDFVNGGREVVDAVADGKRAAQGIIQMADLTTVFAGKIRCPNPFWLASGPPANCGDQVMRAFDAGWGGAVWKTLGDPIVNVSSRYSSVDLNGQRMMGLNNIELITDRPLEVNLREIAEVKKRYPNHAVIASLMVDSKREAWHEIVKRSEGAGADGLELNFGCPHGMSERGMGSAVGQVPEYCTMITAWVKEVAQTPVLVKLTPNITDIRPVARAAKQGGADGLSAINTINSITGIDLDTFVPRPNVDGKSAHGGYCGPAVKPIALHMVQQIADGRHSGLGHRRHLELARCGGVSAARLPEPATLHRADALRLPHRRRHDRRPEKLDGRKRVSHHRRFSRPQPAQCEGVEKPQPELQDRREDQSRQMHRLRPLLHRLLGRRAPVHPSGRASRKTITVTPIPKLDGPASAPASPRSARR